MLAVAELNQILEALLEASVDFILVGGGAAVVQGAPITTQDVDIVHGRDPENVARLMTALAALDAVVLDLAGRRIRPQEAALLGPGQSLLMTRHGRLDVLGSLHDGRGYAALVDHTDLVDLEGRSLRVLDLPTLIDIKSGTGRAKDRLVVPVLLALAKGRSAGPREAP